MKAGPSITHAAPAEGDEYPVENTRKDHPKAYAPWSEKEDQSLKAGYLRGRSISNLATALGRSEGVIRSRLKKLGLMG